MVLHKQLVAPLDHHAPQIMPKPKSMYYQQMRKRKVEGVGGMQLSLIYYLTSLILQQFSSFTRYLIHTSKN